MFSTIYKVLGPVELRTPQHPVHYVSLPGHGSWVPVGLGIGVGLAGVGAGCEGACEMARRFLGSVTQANERPRSLWEKRSALEPDEGRRSEDWIKP